MNAAESRTRTSGITCAIVDDEPLARRILEQYIRDDARLSLAGSFASAADARRLLNIGKPDLLLLDIRMPGTSGISFLRSLTRPPAVIMTTAYSEYAVDGFDLRVLDYLVKPIAYERFVRAVDRAVEILAPRSPDRSPNSSNASVYIRVDQRLIRLNLADIAFVEACENYVRIHTSNKAYMTKRTMQDVESSLADDGFVRVHRSFIVNMRRVDEVRSDALVVAGRIVPISRAARRDVARLFGVL